MSYIVQQQVNPDSAVTQHNQQMQDPIYLMVHLSPYRSTAQSSYSNCGTVIKISIVLNSLAVIRHRSMLQYDDPNSSARWILKLLEDPNNSYGARIWITRGPDSSVKLAPGSKAVQTAKRKLVPGSKAVHIAQWKLSLDQRWSR